MFSPKISDALKSVMEALEQEKNLKILNSNKSQEEIIKELIDNGCNVIGKDDEQKDEENDKNNNS